MRNTYDGLRFRVAEAGSGATTGGDMLTHSIMRAMQARMSPFTSQGLRAPGFRALDSYLDELDALEGYSMRAAAPLPTRSEVMLDSAVVHVGRDRLQFVADLLDAGLTMSLPNALSVPFLETNNQNRTGTARRVMNPESRGESAMPIMLPGRLPIYCTMADFQIDLRTLLMSRRVGMPLDLTMAEADTRAVNEAIEDAALNGATTLDGQDLQVDGYKQLGALNAPNANTKALSLADWQTTPNGANVMTAITQMIAQEVADKKYGPYTLYIPTATSIAWQNDFKANGDNSIMSRIKGITLGDGRAFQVKPLDLLPSTKVLLIQMTSDVVRIIDGIRPMVVPWTSLTGFTIGNIILAIMVPQFRSDYDGNSGIVIGTMS